MISFFWFHLSLTAKIFVNNLDYSKRTVAEITKKTTFSTTLAKNKTSLKKNKTKTTKFLRNKEILA